MTYAQQIKNFNEATKAFELANDTLTSYMENFDFIYDLDCNNGTWDALAQLEANKSKQISLPELRKAKAKAEDALIASLTNEINILEIDNKPVTDVEFIFTTAKRNWKIRRQLIALAIETLA